MIDLAVRYPELRGAGVLVTGGASGIGAALVEGFARQGARVAFIDINDKAANELIATLSGLDQQPLYIHCDLTNVAAVREAVSKAGHQLGSIKVLVNNAGWDDRHEFEAVTEDYWDKSQSINLKSQFFVTQAALPFLRAAPGASVINFSSIAYMMNLPDMPSYVTAKAAIIGLTKGLAGKLGAEGIRVNAVLPGMVLTERQKALWITDEAAAAHRDRQCLRFSLGAKDLVGPCLFLASDGARAITAQSIVVDGGFL